MSDPANNSIQHSGRRTRLCHRQVNLQNQLDQCIEALNRCTDPLELDSLKDEKKFLERKLLILRNNVRRQRRFRQKKLSAQSSESGASSTNIKPFEDERFKIEPDLACKQDTTTSSELVQFDSNLASSNCSNFASDDDFFDWTVFQQQYSILADAACCSSNFSMSANLYDETFVKANEVQFLERILSLLQRTYNDGDKLSDVSALVSMRRYFSEQVYNCKKLMVEFEQ